MGQAVERLLARPTALRLLRYLNSHSNNDWSSVYHVFERCLLQTRNFSASPCLNRIIPDAATHPHRLDANLAHRNRSAKARTCDPVRTCNVGQTEQTKRPPKNAIPQGSFYLPTLISCCTSGPLLESISSAQDPFAALLGEAGVTTPLPRPRLVDNPAHAQNMDIWLDLLNFRKRLHGHVGVRQVWFDMMERNLQLPVHGPIADALWSVFISTALSDSPLLDEVYNHAKQPGQTPHLYPGIVGGCLRMDPCLAIEWHDRMDRDGLVPRHAATIIFDHVLHSQHPDDAFIAFKEIYERSGAHGMYDACMTTVSDVCDYATALRWHTLFVNLDDFPSPSMLSKPIIRHLSAHHDLRGKRPQHGQETSRHNLPNPGSPRSSDLHLNGPASSVHHLPGVKQKRIGDAFCARLFATGAFSVDLVITGLRMLGLDALGVLALREIAARAGSLSEFLSTVDILEGAGISLVDSAYTRALKKFAKEGNAEFFDVVVKSDQHPDTYEDSSLQKTLYASFLTTGKLTEAHATLAILTMSKPRADHFSWNLLLQTYMQTPDRNHILQILHEMRLNHVPLSDYSLHVVFHAILGPRQRGKGPVRGGGITQDLDFVCNIFFMALLSGQKFNQSRWKEILMRYGLTNRLVSFERLVLWLATWHSTRFRNAVAGISRPSYMFYTVKSRVLYPDVTVHPLAQIFTAQLLRATSAWGFISDKGTSEEWTWGIALVRKLRDYGVDTSHSRIRREVKLRLWMLFGPGRSALRYNRTAQRENRLSLLHYIRQINDIWGSNFFILPKDLLYGASPSDEAIYTALFGVGRRRRAYQSKGSATRRARDIDLGAMKSSTQGEKGFMGGAGSEAPTSSEAASESSRSLLYGDPN